jgi:hypothetical protein
MGSRTDLPRARGGHILAGAVSSDPEGHTMSTPTPPAGEQPEHRPENTADWSHAEPADQWESGEEAVHPGQPGDYEEGEQSNVGHPGPDPEHPTYP